MLDLASDDEMGSVEESFHQLQAQVHATLALAAATALAHVWADQDNDDAHAWLRAASAAT
jgi:hypothetical protein